MAKLTYLDEESNHPVYKTVQNRRSALAFAVSVMIIAFILGIFGSIFGLALMSTDGWGLKIRETLGINGLSSLSINSTSTERLILEESSAITDTVKKISPAVVSITTTKQVTDFFGQTTEQSGGGTGFIVTTDGLILTNKHVVNDQNTEYTVVTNDGKKYPAKVLAKDTLNDFAVIQIEASGLPVVEFGDSDNLDVGQWVVAVGNALGQFGNTVTVGVISATNREITASSGAGGQSESLSDMLQTDAAINSGNSGGPLVNLKGQVIGINTAVASNAQNIGFAIPINQVKNVIDFDSIKKTGKIVRPYIGVRYIPITPTIARSSNLKYDYGIYVYSDNPLQPAVVPGSPADKIGIKAGDILLELDGTKINENLTLNNILSKYKPNQKVTIKYLRESEEKTIELTLGTNS